MLRTWSPNFSKTPAPGQIVNVRVPSSFPGLPLPPPLFPPLARSGSASGESLTGDVGPSLHAAAPSTRRATTVLFRTDLETSMTFSFGEDETPHPPATMIQRSRS